MSSPEPTFAISFAYLIVVWTLNRVMRDRAPLQLKWIAVLHNTFLVALSLYMGCEILRNAIVNEFSFVCNRVDRSDAGLPLARVLYIFYISKAYEFIDTFLMAFRKKTAQISFLHLYHHFMTFALWWFGIRFTPGGDSYFSAMLNSFVHVIMYAYYLCSALGVSFPFKKLVTQAQLVQFAVNIVHCVIGLQRGCYDTADNFSPSWMFWGSIAYMFSFLVLFGMFYNETYNAGGNSKSKRDNSKKKE